MTNCPFHDDRTPSMSIFKCDDGSYRYKCFGCGESGDPITYLQKSNDMSFVDAVKALHGAAMEAKRKPVEVAIYDYRDETGTVLYQVVRYEPKTFRQRKRLDNGSYCWSLQGVRRVLYRLPELSNATPGQPIFYVEGEKDADTLLRLGLVATTHCGGANGWRDDYATGLLGHTVIVIPDRDEPGQAMAQRMVPALQRYCRSVGTILIPEGQGKDVTEYVELGHDVSELIQLTEWKTCNT